MFKIYGIDLTEGSLHTFTGIAVFGMDIMTLYFVMRGLESWEK